MRESCARKMRGAEGRNGRAPRPGRAAHGFTVTQIACALKTQFSHWSFRPVFLNKSRNCFTNLIWGVFSYKMDPLHRYLGLIRECPH